ncbi:hypothetical protein BIV57_13365 [Mangrovactinospora gilvigrisea]|uniref:TadE-like domain-containing protein n=1 Tax=Mangrovactinospora gilvigrisea TaxID=1428644 RepID=A0A1J7BEL8_9ACTN|nr:TadE/TadG family type IV pilus assembly protein [Mangrovactinospora gilvigrisea]OIV37021.1 hypothetical protein BIV57_13365 [Mangrovactinospora gilvigrisea]
MRLIRHGRGAGSRGSLSLEAAILAPVIFGILGLAIMAGRVALARSAVDLAARSAAREASLARTAGDASARGHAMAVQVLGQQHLKCADSGVNINVNGFSTPLGTSGMVTAGVRCTENLSDVMFGVPLPGSVTLASTFSSPVDAYRER